MENEKEIISLIVYVSVLIVILIVFVVSFFLAYQRRKTQLLIEKAEERQKFEQELAKAQTEIQEQTFKNISWELHDNIGQLLSVAKMQLNMLKTDVPDEQKKSFEEASNVLGQGLKELRQLSHALNTDFVSNIGLQESLENEINRFKRLNFLRIEYDVEGIPYDINKKDEIIIFRIFQECFSNVVKYSKASLLTIIVKYLSHELYVNATDNGIGFDIEAEKKGTGLLNMRKRAELIGANFSIKTGKNEGVSVTLKYPTKPTKNEKV
ncbi:MULTISPECIES: sensor histidine kinase [Galbibacter]|uniref:histidine kinase n=1 Tax=Galbibacter pacificus TaxID=2996052 RepID=A0ABT6FQ73_9FLAO|nr:histidine kinase [Galbibacter pacificus]MDG3582154.1 histidine kinase [Galbibacter pacificus]MDG3585370.1 histidine kinase [Galbibacter pacificus]